MNFAAPLSCVTGSLPSDKKWILTHQNKKLTHSNSQLGFEQSQTSKQTFSTQLSYLCLTLIQGSSTHLEVLLEVHGLGWSFHYQYYLVIQDVPIQEGHRSRLSHWSLQTGSFQHQGHLSDDVTFLSIASLKKINASMQSGEWYAINVTILKNAIFLSLFYLFHFYI